MSQGVGSAFTADWISTQDIDDLTSRDLSQPAMHSRSSMERSSISGKRCLSDWLASTPDSTRSTTSKRKQSHSHTRKKPRLLLFLTLCSLASGSPIRDPASPSSPLLLADAAPSTPAANWRLKRSAPVEKSNVRNEAAVTSSSGLPADTCWWQTVPRIYVTGFP